MAGISGLSLQCYWFRLLRERHWKKGMRLLSPHRGFHKNIRCYSDGETMDSTGILVRPAQESDYEDVLAILPNLYSGADYMPDKYHSFITDPFAHPFVAEINGKVVAFANYYVTENGTVAAATGGRSKSEFKGRGISAKVIRASLGAAVKRYPQIRTEARVAVDSDFYKPFRLANNEKNYRIVLERDYVQYATKTENLLTLLAYLKQLPEVYSKSLECVNDMKIIKSQTIKKSFKEGHYIWGNNRLPAVANRENLLKTLDTCKAWGSLETSTRFNEVYNTISIGAFMTTTKGQSLDVSINGRCTFLRTLEHICSHLEDRAGNLQLRRNAYLQLCFPNDSAEVKVELKKVLGEFLGTVTRSEDFPSETILILHRPVPIMKTE